MTYPELDKAEPVAWMHPIGAIWRADNYPAGMDFSKGGWIALVPASELAASRERERALERSVERIRSTLLRSRRGRSQAAEVIAAAIRALADANTQGDGDAPAA